MLSDGRMLTTDLGDQAPGDPGNGQFIVWFGEPEGTDQTYCKVDIELATAQSLLVGPDDEVYVVSARPPSSGVWRYTDLPTSADAAGGCGRTDVTGAPMADAVTREQVLAPGQNDILSPAGIAFSPNGGYYLSSVITGVINEYDADWQFVRTILAPPAGGRHRSRRVPVDGHPAGHRGRLLTARSGTPTSASSTTPRTASARVTAPVTSAASCSSTASPSPPRPWPRTWPSPTASGSTSPADAAGEGANPA